MGFNNGNDSCKDPGSQDQQLRLDEEASLYKMRHSCAHILAQAVIERFSESGSVKLGVGPAIADGFYYDFQLPRPLNSDDLGWLEVRMKEIVKSGCDFSYSKLGADDARQVFQDQPFKMELIDLICSGQADPDAQEDANTSSEDRTVNEVSIYRHDRFVDLCKGPHVHNSREINPDALKLLHTSGSFWRGNERNPMLTRIYGTVFASKKELEKHMLFLEEAKRRDHRRLGKKLELFHFDETAPGMPYWLPNGMRLLNELFSFWRDTHEKHGYEEISSPLLNHKSLWETSGHWEHYNENMFLVEDEDDTVYGLKPMNCPNAMVVFGLKLRSYRDLPMRLSDCDVLHRNERSGTLNGLFRVQKFQQDDAHIFVSPDQIEDEFKKVLTLAAEFYSVFNMSYSYRLSLRPNKFVGDVEKWDEAENALRRILDRQVGKDNYMIAEKEGAFYGPKIDILMRDSLGRKWQMGNIQLDFQLPERFGLKYIDKDGQHKTPAVIHRVIYGSIDRFIGILLEHTNGELPVWLAPLQVVLIPIADRHIEYAKSIGAILNSKRIRHKVDDGSARMNRKIRDWEIMKVPYICILGDDEMNSSTVSFRSRGKGDERGVRLSKFTAYLSEIIESKTNKADQDDFISD
ncbi:MAG: threonine--tRNA ligase [Candidatus Obscuribacterales bacterium]|nr:threonine--tRNA ligase [Candidatus Obscuribacterales bacterium]